jgi:cytochrome P450
MEHGMINQLLIVAGHTYDAMAAPFLLAVGVSFLLILVSVYAFQLMIDARRRLPPGPLPLPVIGNLLDIGRGGPNRSLARLAKRYGPLMSVRLGVVHAVVVSSTDVAREILQKHNSNLAGRPVINVWLANGHRANSIIVSPPNARWRALRKFCTTELFAASRLNALQPLRQHKVQELLRYVSDQVPTAKPITIRDLVITASMNMLSRTLFSVDLESGPSVRGLKVIIKEATVLAAVPNVSDFFPAIASADLQGFRRRMAPLVARAYQIIDEQFEQRLRDREAHEPHKNDMLDAVLDGEHEWKKEGSLIDRDVIKGMFTVRSTCTNANLTS